MARENAVWRDSLRQRANESYLAYRKTIRFLGGIFNSGQTVFEELRYLLRKVA